MEKVVLHTAGDGYWSDRQAAVEITDIKLGYVDDERSFGELCVYFNTETWNVDEDGLIYTDSLFASELNRFLADHGLATAEYSEQGMQGDNYVSLDVDADFIRLWDKKFN